VPWVIVIEVVDANAAPEAKELIAHPAPDKSCFPLPTPFAKLALTKDLLKSTALIVVLPEPAVLPRCIDFITCVPKTAIFLS